MACLPACSKEPPASPAPTLEWTPGITTVYGLELDSKLAVGADPPVSLRLRASLEAGAAADRKRLGLAMRDIELTSGSGFDSALTAALSAPIALETAGARIQALELGRKLPAGAVGIWKAIASALSFSQGKGARWYATESDEAGTYSAEYVVGKPGWVEKKKTHYEQKQVHAAKTGFPGLKVDTQVISSSGHFLLGNGRLVERVSIEALDSRWNDAPFAHSETRIKLERRGERRGSLPLPEQAVLVLRLDEAYRSPENDTRAVDLARAKGLFFPAVVAELERSTATLAAQKAPGAAQPAQTTQSSPAFSQLVALLRVDEANTRRASGLARKGGGLVSVLVDALGSASTPAAQEELVALAGDGHLPAALRKRAAFVLLRSRAPAADLHHRAAAWLSDPLLRELTLYGLGTTARNLRENGQVQASKQVVELLATEMKNAKGPKDVVGVLRGLANSASVAALPMVQAKVADPDPSIRSASDDALARIRDSRVVPLLAERLTKEQDTVARVNLVKALRQVDASGELAGAVAKALGAEKNPQVLLALVELAGQWLRKRPELRPMLKRLADSGELPELRERAARLLAPS